MIWWTFRELQSSSHERVRDICSSRQVCSIHQGEADETILKKLKPQR
jgi:hypothetical protein